MAEPAGLPGTEQLGRGLLHAYAAHWLGLVPEGQPRDESSAVNQYASFIRQPIGSRLPLPRVSLLLQAQHCHLTALMTDAVPAHARVLNSLGIHMSPYRLISSSCRTGLATQCGRIRFQKSQHLSWRPYQKRQRATLLNRAALPTS